MSTYNEWIAEARQRLKPPAVSAEHVPTENERNNLVHLCFVQFFDHSYRPVDFTIIEMMAKDIRSITDLRERYVPVIAEYIWDHWMGEPEDPTVESVKEVCLVMADALFSMDETTRNDINTISE